MAANSESQVPNLIYLTLPDLDLGSVPIRVSLWLVEAGSEVSEGDRLLEILAGEVSVDLPSPASGVLVETLVSEDDELHAGQKLAVIEVRA